MAPAAKIKLPINGDTHKPSLPSSNRLPLLVVCQEYQVDTASHSPSPLRLKTVLCARPPALMIPASSVAARSVRSCSPVWTNLTPDGGKYSTAEFLLPKMSSRDRGRYVPLCCNTPTILLHNAYCMLCHTEFVLIGKSRTNHLFLRRHNL